MTGVTMVMMMMLDGGGYGVHNDNDYTLFLCVRLEKLSRGKEGARVM